VLTLACSLVTLPLRRRRRWLPCWQRARRPCLRLSALNRRFRIFSPVDNVADVVTSRSSRLRLCRSRWRWQVKPRPSRRLGTPAESRELIKLPKPPVDRIIEPATITLQSGLKSGRSLCHGRRVQGVHNVVPCAEVEGDTPQRACHSGGLQVRI